MAFRALKWFVWSNFWQGWWKLLFPSPYLLLFALCLPAVWFLFGLWSGSQKAIVYMSLLVAYETHRSCSSQRFARCPLFELFGDSDGATGASWFVECLLLHLCSFVNSFETKYLNLLDEGESMLLEHIQRSRRRQLVRRQFHLLLVRVKLDLSQVFQSCSATFAVS